MAISENIYSEILKFPYKIPRNVCFLCLWTSLDVILLTKQFMYIQND